MQHADAFYLPLPAASQALFDLFAANGHTLYAVGGCVRDCLMQKTPQDWDFCTDATPAQMRAVLQGHRLLETGIKHGTFTVIINHIPYEITTFRTDGAYLDHRHPQQVQFTQDIHADLSRRDFTINAMAYHPQEGLVDPFGGRADLAKCVLRCVGDPDIRFEEDALRIMRALRFRATLDFHIEAKTAESLLRKYTLLQQIAAERIQKELSRLLCGKAAAAALAEFAPVFFMLLPPLAKTDGCTQNNRYHSHDVWEHTRKSLSLVPPTLPLRLAMLLHDIGKPVCKTTDENGVTHFHGHAQSGAVLTEALLRQLRYSNKIIQTVTQLVALHDLRLHEQPEQTAKWLGKLGGELFFQLLDVMQADNAAKNGADTEIAALESIRQEAQQLLAQKACLTLADLALNGDDLLQAGIPAGKAVGKTLRFLLEQVQSGTLANTREALLQSLK